MLGRLWLGIGIAIEYFMYIGVTYGNPLSVFKINIFPSQTQELLTLTMSIDSRICSYKLSYLHLTGKTLFELRINITCMVHWFRTLSCSPIKQMQLISWIIELIRAQHEIVLLCVLSPLIPCTRIPKWSSYLGFEREMTEWLMCVILSGGTLCDKILLNNKLRVGVAMFLIAVVMPVLVYAYVFDVAEKLDTSKILGTCVLHPEYRYIHIIGWVSEAGEDIHLINFFL